MQQGVSNREACRIVGIAKRTGQKWRNGRHATGTGRRWHRSTRWQRLAGRPGTCARKTASTSPTGSERRPRPRAIAAVLGRSPSTISREIRRKRQPANGQYRPRKPRRQAQQRQSRFAPHGHEQ
ncbi:helix-turn-helix domain-containing protein [Streptomyces sp. 378]|uniref:helix-turn-helix domain-containing protein n=1 Tax=Streptomyces sp. 378 TaxID=3049412 RepID=UPI0024C21015|nr:helix-turn-helix domain-containing protein [Streptomyces sp. 378]MDK1346475.1 helix-turn-helix domain-containing protein [Streptomyces sp. 378]